MKKNFLLMLFVQSIFLSAFCQNVGIGTTNPLNKLHVAGGFRLDTLVGVGGNGLLRHDANGVVYGIRFTGSVTDVLRGDGTFGAAPSSPAAWLLTGNAGTNPATNFIGTTDAEPLYFKVNNSLAGHIDITSNNTAFGLAAIASNTTGVTNTAFGFSALYANTEGYANTAQGHTALNSNTTGNQNTAFGYSAMSRNTTGNQNTAIGVTSLYSNFTGSNNTAIGFGADVSTDGLTNATAIGYNAKVAQSNSIVLGTGANVGIGTSSPQSKLHLVGSFRMDTVSNGADSGILRHDKNGVIYSLKFTGVATDVLRGDGTFGSGGSGAVGWLLSGNSGTNPSTQFLGTSDAEPLFFRVNNITAGQIQLSNTNTGFGLGTLANTTGNFNTAFGNYVLYSNTTGRVNTGVGEGALYSNTTGNFNTANGDDALYYNTTGVSNTAMGDATLYANTTGNSNTATGDAALVWNTTGNYNTAVGADALRFSSTGSGNTATGYGSLRVTSTGENNTATGFEALYSNTTGIFNTANGSSALHSNTTGGYNTANGYQALALNTTGIRNSANGESALFHNTSGHDNVANGNSSLIANTTGYQNTANGVEALSRNTTGNSNNATGFDALDHNTTGAGNVADGVYALQSNTTGSGNDAHGYSALFSNTTGSDNSANGFAAMYSNTTGTNNTAIGFAALYGTTSSQYNTAVGFSAGSSYDNGYNNVFLGANTDVSGPDFYNCIAIGQGVVCTDVNMAIIGNGSTTKWGFGVVPASGNAFQVGTNSSNGNGAHLTAGGTWVNGSSISFKDDFTTLDKKEILNKISSLNISRWHYKGTGNEYHIGPIAEEFYQLFNVGTDKKYISTVDPAGIALAGIQQLVKENEESKQTVKQLQKNLEMQQVINEKQQKQIDELAKELQVIKEKIK